MSSVPPLLQRYQSLKAQLSKHATIKVFRLYWTRYGGWKALLSSPYIYLSILLTVLCYPLWNTDPTADGFFRPWSQLAVDIVPSMLGFSLGGMAIMLAFSGADHFKIIAQDGKPDSLYITVIANFFHFVLMQTIALCMAFVSKAYPNDIFSSLGFFFMSYAIFVGVATAGQLLVTSQIFNAIASLPENSTKNREEDSGKDA